MPPEQLPWDRRDFRKHDRSGSDRRLASGGGGRGGFGGGDHRWREQHHHPHPPPYHHHRKNPHQQHWYSDFRSSRPIPLGHVKQGGWGMHPDEAGRGFSPFGSSYSDRNLENDNFRPFGSRGEGRYFRSSRENRGSFSQKDWKSPSWEPPVASSGGSGEPNNEVGNPKPVENALTCPSNSSKGNNPRNAETRCNNSSKGTNYENSPTSNINANNSSLPPDSLSGQPQAASVEKNEKDGGTGDEPVSLVKKSYEANTLTSIDWKLKWNHSGSFSSRGPGLSHSSSAKSTGVDSTAEMAGLQLNNTAPVDSPAAVCVEPLARASSDDTSSRKKPRLGWGEGLAKYEKKKVEGPEDGSAKDGLDNSVSTTETMQFTYLDGLGKSLKATDMLLCASPATPSSVACSSSPGIEEKEFTKAVNIDHDPANLSFSPSIMPQIHCEEPTSNLENLELASIANLSSLINGMLHPNDPTSVEAGYVHATSMNKLLALKVNVLKALEVTESEVDLLETELKSLVAEPRSRCPCPAASSLLPGECHSNSSEQGAGSRSVTPDTLPVVASGDMTVVNPADDEHSMDDEDDDEDEYDTACLDDDKSIAIDCQDHASVGIVHFDYYNIYEAILASNRDSANRAFEELNEFLPVQQRPFDVLAAANVSSLHRDSSVIKDRFLMRKRSLLFKEKVLGLKFKVFQHFWREGRVVSVIKLRGKSHKKLDLCRTGYKKNRSSSRSRISCSAGSSRKVPSEEVIEFINGLLRESMMNPCRSTLKMPAMILDKGIKMSRFVSNNALMEDPCAAERERSMINPWTPRETEIFIDKLSNFGKDFSKIATFLEHKSAADCIEFYYRNHKSESFQRAKPGVTKQSKFQSTTYMVANRKRWNREANAASLDVLGEASMIAANALETPQKCSSMIFVETSSSPKAPPSIFYGPLERLNTLDNDDAEAADVLAGICGSLSSGEAMSSCITSSVDPTDRYHQRVTCIKRPLTPDVTQSVDDECSDESYGEMVEPPDWTDEEKSFFVQALSSYGKDFVMISKCLRTKSVEQCKMFFSKARKCLGLDRITPGPGNAAVCGGGVDGGGGSSDTEDACVVHTGSLIANSDSEWRMEVDLPENCAHESGMPGTSKFKTCGETTQPCSLNSTVAEPVLKTSSMANDTLVGDRQLVNFHVDGIQSCVVGAFTPMLDMKVPVVSVRVEEGSDHVQPNGGSSDADNEGLSEVSDGHHMENNEGQGLILSDDNLGNKKVEDVGAKSTEVNVASCTPVEGKVENISRPSVDSLLSFQKCSGNQNLLLEQNGHFASMESSTLFSVPIKYQRHSSTDAPPDVCVNGTGQNHPQKVALEGGRQQHVSGYSLSDPAESSHILRGYPVSVRTLKEINGDVIEHVPTKIVPKRNGKLKLELHSDFSLHRCSTGLRNQIENVPFLSPQLPLPGPQSGCSPELDKPQPSGNGGVKLFGKILKSSQEKSNSSDRDVGINNKNDQHHERAGHHRHLLAPKFSGDSNALNLDSFQSNVDFSSYFPSESNIPLKSFGCWDDNRKTQPTVFPPLPDSAVLLAKYPAAFSNQSALTLKFDQPPPLNDTIRNNDYLPFFPSGGINSGLTDCQIFRNGELQPFSVDNMKQRQDVFSELQRRNGLSVVQGMQQQAARSIVGTDIGRGGVLIGSQCSGVSDPVTAIKLHYAKAQGVITEDDTWRSNGGDGGR